MALERNEKINRIINSIKNLNAIFQQMSLLVVDQGTILDRIDYNIRKAHERAKKAKEELFSVYPSIVS